MRALFVFALAALAASPAAFGQANGDSVYQVGYATNLNVGDSVVNFTNDGNGSAVETPEARLGSLAIRSHGTRVRKVRSAAPRAIVTAPNLCVNTYVFDPREEEIGCCACLVTPNGLNSLSAKADLVSNNLTADVPTSIVIKLLGSTPDPDPSGNLTICNPANVNIGNLVNGMMAWGSTLEPNATPGTYGVVDLPFLSGTLGFTELPALTSACNFIQANGSGFGICRSCRLGSLGGAKK